MEAIKQIIADQFAIGVADIDLHKTFADLGGDELDFWEIIIGVEDALSIEIPDTAFADDQNTRIGEFIDQIARVVGVEA